jgi:hypothetical protein
VTILTVKKMTLMTELFQRMASSAIAHHVSTFFINGLPGSGKSRLLSSASQELPNLIPRSILLGPYLIENISDSCLCKDILDDFEDSSFLSTKSDHDFDLSDITRFFSQLRTRIHLRTSQYAIVFIELHENVTKDTKTLGDFFSRLRRLEGLWNQGHFRLLVVVCGFWDHVEIKSYFDKVFTSLPYTPSRNLFDLRGISKKEMYLLVKEKTNVNSLEIISSFIYELIDGHPGSAISVLDNLEKDSVSVFGLLDAIKRAATDSIMTNRFLSIWRKLPPDSKSLISKLMNQKYLKAPMKLPPYMERLLNTGLVNHCINQKQSFLKIRSWYVELILHKHAKELGIVDVELDIDETIPASSALCIEGYRVVNEIENLVRNFVVLNLWKSYCDGDPHPLIGRVIRYDDFENKNTDIYERATKWAERNARRGVSSTLINPLIAHISTRDLVELVEEAAAEVNYQSWQRIANSLKNLKGVRDAIMHNQLIDEVELENLYNLRDEIIEACMQDKADK